MAEYGEWNRKGATLSDKTVIKDYGVDREFIVKGIRAGKLEFQERSVWGNPYFVILRRQLKQYIAEELGDNHLSGIIKQKKIHTLKKEINETKHKLQGLELELAALEKKE
ncbi:hypothetical protein ACKUB1_11660 [Methanospirillum stamsii]|uniref:Uncharacterized protein n=1 Tax=Methanospirillum stamsii TaxID=1277351 RepID=A0A2V2MZC1_9EURY|nr:hypothetical protein [Methanospirillum stamsii]PWR69668.1 hypothetical protein DLD82_17245 [Methanospirillum stamsii]